MNTEKIDNIKNFNDFLKKICNPVIINFYAPWCDDCIITNNIFKDLSQNKEFENIAFLSINIDTDNTIRDYCNINSVPTFQIFYKTKYICEYIGTCNKQIIHLLNYLNNIYKKHHILT